VADQLWLITRIREEELVYKLQFFYILLL